ncbi:hypothetical protein CHU98_g9730 [Xylaria longipes]|nr:hypothetical protein CHU98_g9730 [Xylaria longipes]
MFNLDRNFATHMPALQVLRLHTLLAMHLLTIVPFFLCPVTSLSQLPNFWLAYMKLDSYDPHYRHQAGGVFTTPSGDPSWACDDATYNSDIWSNKGDVSGNKLGMRCDPSQDVGFPLYRDPLEVVEFNTGKFWAGHQSTYAFSYYPVYSDRDYGLYDLDNRKTAQCYGELDNVLLRSLYLAEGRHRHLNRGLRFVLVLSKWEAHIKLELVVHAHEEYVRDGEDDAALSKY